MDERYKLTPLDYAISTIDQTIADLLRRRAELEAQLPERPPPRRVKLRDPRVMRGEREEVKPPARRRPSKRKIS